MRIMPNDPMHANRPRFAPRYADGMPKTFVGSRVRQLRTERGLSQAALAQMLEISPSYLNQIEHDVRPLTVAVLLRITEVFGVDATFFASRDDTRLVAELREVMVDGDLDAAIHPAEVADMVSAHPAIARAVVNLHRRYRITTAQLAEATEDRFNDGSGSGSITMPHEEVRDYFYQRQNYLHELDTAAEDLTARMRMHRGDLAGELSRRLTEVHGVHIIRRIDLGETVLHHYHPASKTLEISTNLSSGQQVFKMAAELAYLEVGDLIDTMVTDGKFTSDESRRLARLGLANYFAAAAVLPYGQFHDVSENFGYDIERLSRLLPGELRDHLPSAVHSAATLDAGGAVLVRPGGQGRQHVKASVRHRIPLLVLGRNVPAVECLRDVLQSRQDPGAARPDAGRAQLPVGGPDRGAPRAPVRPAGQDIRDRAGLRCAPGRPAGVLPGPGPVLGQRDADRFGLSGLRTGQLSRSGPSPRWARALDIDEHRSTVSPYLVKENP